MVRLSRSGNAALKVKFSSGTVDAVEVTLVNASTRFTQCFRQSTPFSCSGKPVDQARRSSVQGTVVTG
jgi:hypothetical protein